MKKTISLILALVIIIGALSATAFAVEAPSFHFGLTVDGSDTKLVKTGDIITVVLRLKRTDTADKYTMYAMQDEVRYDSDFFELVEGSALLCDYIVTTDIGMRDNYREFYMNYLSTSGGTSWDPDTLVGSFQLRVIATSGITKITNQDYLVSTQDGTASFPCTANEVTVMLTTECFVHFENNGGSKVNDQTVQYGDKVVKPADPIREGYSFDGWYKDIDLTEAWNFENDTVSGNMTLFADWKKVSTTDTVNPPAGDHNNWMLAVIGVLLALILLVVLLPRKKITFDPTGGSEVKTKYVLKNSKLKEPKMPHKYRKVFAGWYRDEACTIAWDFDVDKVEKDITLFAKWL